VKIEQPATGDAARTAYDPLLAGARTRRPSASTPTPF